MYKDFNYFVSGTYEDVEKLAHALLRAVDTARLVIVNEGDAKDGVRIKAENGNIEIDYDFSDKKWSPEEEEEEEEETKETDTKQNEIDELFKDLLSDEDDDDLQF